MACEHNKFTSITDGNEFEWCRYFPNNYFGRGGSTSLSGTSTSTSSYVYTKSSASNSGAQEGSHTNNGPNSNNDIKLASQIFYKQLSFVQCMSLASTAFILFFPGIIFFAFQNFSGFFYSFRFWTFCFAQRVFNP